MNKVNLIWTVVLVVIAAFLIFMTVMGKMGRSYVEKYEVDRVRFLDPKPFDPNNEVWRAARDAEEFAAGLGIEDYRIPDVSSADRIVRYAYRDATPAQYRMAQQAGPDATHADPDHVAYMFSWPRTIGLWVAAIITLSIFSFLYKDNPLYKIAESTVIGVSAGYWMVVGFHAMLIPNLFGKLFPLWVKAWALPGLQVDTDEGFFQRAEWQYLVPLVLGIMLLWRLAPKGGWISRWPLAFIIGTTAGFRLIGFLQADFVAQIRNSIDSLYVRVPEVGDINLWFTFWHSMGQVTIVIGVLACLVYFFFSIEHKGLVGRTAKLGIWFLMVTFGAAFGYTVMGRIALLAIRVEFLVDDWLWIIDPLSKRLVAG